MLYFNIYIIFLRIGKDEFLGRCHHSCDLAEPVEACFLSSQQTRLWLQFVLTPDSEIGMSVIL